MVYLKSLAGGALFATIASSAVILPRQSTSLNDAFVAAGKSYFGTCSDQALLQNSENEAVLNAQFGALTPENSMKWDSIEREYSALGVEVLSSISDFCSIPGQF